MVYRRSGYIRKTLFEPRSTGYGDHRVRLFWPRIPRKNVVAGYFGLPSSVLVRQPGCYGFQIDGSTFTEHIVVRVVS